MKASSKYFAIGLRLGICESSDVQKWVDEEINKSNIPSEQLIDLAFMKETDIMDVYSVLTSIPDLSDEYEILRCLLGTVKPEKLNSLHFCRRLAECLYYLWVENDYQAPEDLNPIGFFDDEYALAAEGTYGTLEKWHDNFKEFISSFKDNC